MLQTLQMWYLVDQFEKPLRMNQLLAQIRFGLKNTRSLLWFGPAVLQLTHVLVFNAAPEDLFSVGWHYILKVLFWTRPLQPE